MIEFKDVRKHYRMGDSTYEALKGVSFRIEAGEVVAIIGPSGSGKTTTMNIIGLLDHPSSGQYLLNNQETANFSRTELASLRNRTIGFIFQSFFLLPRLTAWQNVGLPLFYRGENAGTIRSESLVMLEKVGMAQYARHRPTELSGGQQQRVAIARALVGKPDIILADEPTGALDSVTSQKVLDLLLHQAKGTTVVMITHDPDVAKQCERIFEIHDGLIQ